MQMSPCCDLYQRSPGDRHSIPPDHRHHHRYYHVPLGRFRHRRSIPWRTGSRICVGKKESKHAVPMHNAKHLADRRTGQHPVQYRSAGCRYRCYQRSQRHFGRSFAGLLCPADHRQCLPGSHRKRLHLLIFPNNPRKNGTLPGAVLVLIN